MFVRRVVSRYLHTGLTIRQAEVELTAVRYPNVKRGNFAKLTDSDVQHFRQILAPERVLTDPEDVMPYNVDWLRMVRGSSQLVLKPKTTEEVAAILRHCNDRGLAVCPQGGNTGLVGGSVPVFDEVVLSTSLMNHIISLDQLSGVLVCQAGCVLENLENYLLEHGFIMPLDLGAKGSCQIGGNVATNAGGIRLLRYGSLQGSVLGVEAVKADGEVIDCLSSLKKDNTGYHLKHLFIGSEGTLGLITKVAIHCPASPKAINVAFLGLETFEDVLKTFQEARHGLGEILSSCEMMDALSLDAATSNLGLKKPIGDYPFYMLIETAGSESNHDEQKLSAFLENSMANGTVVDGTVASEPSRIKQLWDLRELIPFGMMKEGYFYAYDVSLPLQHLYEIIPPLTRRLAGTSVIRCTAFCHLGKADLPSMWSLREGITEGLRHDGYVYKYDISLPHVSFYAIIPELEKRLPKDKVKRCCGYGHVGDGNLHLNITTPQFDPEVLALVEPFVFEWTSKLKGSVSAEHGIGFKKTQYIHYSKSNSSLNLMANIKKLMDPKGILNPYKVLPAAH